jgi:hypothetical protein
VAARTSIRRRRPRRRRRQHPNIARRTGRVP